MLLCIKVSVYILVCHKHLFNTGLPVIFGLHSVSVCFSDLLLTLSNLFFYDCDFQFHRLHQICSIPFTMPVVPFTLIQPAEGSIIPGQIKDSVPFHYSVVLW